MEAICKECSKIFHKSIFNDKKIYCSKYCGNKFMRANLLKNDASIEELKSVIKYLEQTRGW